MWRIRLILGLLTAYFLWKAVFSGRDTLLGYSESAMITYILVASLLQSLVLATRSIDLAGIINSGDLSNILTKPISNFWYWLSRDLADKVLNIIFAAAELSILYLLLRPQLVFPPLAHLVPLVLLVLPLATFLYYLINYLFGLLGFWTPEVWAPRFLLFVILQFVAGSLFPLDVLPLSIQKIVSFTPFPYLIFFPTQLYLGKVPGPQIITGIIAGLFWIVIFTFIVKITWAKGLKAYGAEGR
jgi:ABC-2 type transport system permease protein